MPFKVFLTTTLNQGHINGIDHGEALIFPVTARDEEWQATTQESMFNYVRLSDGGIERLDNVRSEVSILAAIGKRLLPNSSINFDNFSQHNTIRKTIANTIPGMEALKDIDVAKKEFHIRNRIKHQPEFKTEDQKAHFITHPIPSTDNREYPYTLASIRSEGQFNSIIYEETDSYRYNAPRHSLLMGDIDMKALNLKNGDTVNIKSPYGEMKNLTIQAFDLPPGNVLAYYPEANVLTGKTLDPRSKTPNFKSVRVRIQRIDF